MQVLHLLLPGGGPATTWRTKLNRVFRIIGAISNICGYAAGVLVLGSVLLVLCEVFFRYVLHNAPMLADEATAYAFIAICFLGLVYTAKEKGHIRVTAVTGLLPRWMAKWLRLMTLAIFLVIGFIITKATFDLWFFLFMRGVRSTTWLRIPLYLPISPMLVGSGLLCIVLIMQIVQAAIRIKRTGEEEV